MNNQTTIQIQQRIAAALDERARAKPVRAEDNPLGNHDLKRLTQGKGVRTGADQIPAQNMAEHGGLALDMEEARVAGLKDGRADKSAQRMRAARARAARKVQIDQIATKPVQPSAARMTAAWLVLMPLVPIIERIALSKRQWASRFLGSIADDIAQMAVESTALVLAKSDHDLEVLRVAAEELGGETSRTGRVPADQVTDEQRQERRRVAKARKWLMGVANNRVMGALVDAYTDQRNLRWDNIDVIATVMASINGVGDDPLMASFKADRAPAMLGAKYQRPGSIDPALLSQAITAAITERRLDPITEILLHEDNRRSNGQVKWSACAEAIFLVSPGEHGPWMWDAVVRATAGMGDERRARGVAARTHVQNLFAWLPGFIVDVVQSFDIHQIGYAGAHRAVMASHFELFYASEPSEHRELLRPALTFASTQEAAAAIAEHLAILVAGEDVVRSVMFA